MATNPTDAAAKARAKKARRKAQAQAERASARDLDKIAGHAVEAAMLLAPEVADAAGRKSSERVVDVEFTTVDAAKYALKRVNEALTIGEWLDDVEAWVWMVDIHTRAPMSAHGEKYGVELRLEKPVNRVV